MQNVVATCRNEWHKTDTARLRCVRRASGLNRRSTLGRYIAPAYKRLASMLGYSLSLGTFEAWTAFSAIAAVTLSAKERAALAFAALKALDPQHAEITAAAALGSAGTPLPAFMGGMDEARQWATYAIGGKVGRIAATGSK